MGVRRYRFAEFELDVPGHALTRDGDRVSLPPLSFELLTVLVESAPASVSRRELIDSLWPDRIVGDETLTERVKLLRQVIENDPLKPELLLTERGWGYRLTVEPEPISATGAASGGQGRGPSSARRFLLALLLAVVALVAAVLLRPRSTAPAAATIAILPFENRTGDPARDYLVAGVRDELQLRLAGIAPERLIVLARTSADRVSVEPEQAQSMALDHLLEGGLRLRGSEAVLSLRLADVADGRQWWSRDFTTAMPTAAWLREVANEVAIALTLDVVLVDEVAAPIPREAWEAYLRGRHAWRNWTDEGFRDALAQFERAVTLAPDFAEAHAGIADALGTLIYYGQLAPEAQLATARWHADRAMAIDATLASALTSTAMLDLFFDYAPDRALALLTQASASAPNDPDVLLGLSNVFWALGCPDRAVAVLGHALRADPYAPIVQTSLAWSELLAGATERALTHAERALRWEPDYPAALFVAATAEGLLGRPERAIERLTDHDGDDLVSALGYWLVAAGRTDAAQALLDRRWGPRSALARARLHVALGDEVSAGAALDEALELRIPELVFVAHDPLLGDVRRSERLESMLAGFRSVTCR